MDIFIWCQSLETFHMCWSRGVTTCYIVGTPSLVPRPAHADVYLTASDLKAGVGPCRLISDPVCGDLPLPWRVDESPDVAGKGTTMYCISAIILFVCYQLLAVIHYIVPWRYMYMFIYHKFRFWCIYPY